jgi:hypothetical protein
MFWLSGLLLLQKKKLKRKTHKHIENKEGGGTGRPCTSIFRTTCTRFNNYYKYRKGKPKQNQQKKRQKKRMKMIKSPHPKNKKKRKENSSSSSRLKKPKKCYPPPVWGLHERLSLEMVAACLDPAKGLPLDHRDRPVLEYILQHTDRESGLLRVEYHYSKHRQSGRVYASNSLQRLSSKVRNLCIPNDDKSIDVDIANAHPEILCQVFKKHDIHAPVMEKYTTDRDEIISRIVKQYPELTRKDVKKAFITAQNQGCYKKQATGGQRIEFLDEFTAELKRAASELYQLKEYNDIREHVETDNGEKQKKQKQKNLLGSFIFHVCEDVELQLITTARDTLQQSGFVVRVNMYDGLIVEPLSVLQKEEEEHNKLDLDKLNEAVTQATGYVVRFVIKPIVRSTMQAIRSDCMMLSQQQQQQQQQQQLKIDPNNKPATTTTTTTTTVAILHSEARTQRPAKYQEFSCHTTNRCSNLHQL